MTASNLLDWSEPPTRLGVVAACLSLLRALRILFAGRSAATRFLVRLRRKGRSFAGKVITPHNYRMLFSTSVPAKDEDGQKGPVI